MASHWPPHLQKHLLPRGHGGGELILNTTRKEGPGRAGCALVLEVGKVVDECKVQAGAQLYALSQLVVSQTTQSLKDGFTRNCDFE